MKVTKASAPRETKETLGRAPGLQPSAILGTRLQSISKFYRLPADFHRKKLMADKNLKSHALDPRSVFAPQFHAASQFYFLFISILTGSIKHNCHRTKEMDRIGKGGNAL